MAPKLWWRSVIVCVFLVLAVAGGRETSAASSGGTARAVTNATLRTKILVDSGGFTLYHRTSEKRGSITCTGACRRTWPPLLVAGSGKPVPGAGLSGAKLGAIKRPDGGDQVTYNGYALYRFSGDKRAGQTNGQGVGSQWYAMTPAGTVTFATAKTSAASSPSSGSTTSSHPTGSGGSGGSGAPVGSNGCPLGQVIPQGISAGDGDEDNTNGGDPEDGDGCS
jgi:predicted lipoprotein with Yx(FWY)xxD motif